MSALPQSSSTPSSRRRAGSSDGSSIKSFLDSGPSIAIPLRQETGGSELKSALSKSAPTTPGLAKKHAHFDNVKIEHRYSLHRTITAPSSFESTPSLLLAETQELPSRTLVVDDEVISPPESPSYASTASSDDSSAVFLEASDSRSLLRRFSAGQSTRPLKEPAITRWSSDPGGQNNIARGSPRVQNERPTLTNDQSDSSSSNHSGTSSTHARGMQLPDEDTATASDASRTAPDKTLRRTPTRRHEVYRRHDLSADKVDSKLAEWSRGEEEYNGRQSPGLRPQSRSSRYPSGDEGVPAPPNTGKSSLAPSRPESAPRSQATTPGSDPPTPSWILRSGETRSSSPVHVADHGPIGNISKGFLSMSERERFQLIPRDSLDVHRKHMEDHRADPVNCHLANAKDSFLVSKTRLEKYPKSDRLVQPTFSRLAIGGLSPIQDASPPDPRQYLTKSQRDNKRPGRNGTSIVPEIKPAAERRTPAWRAVATSAEVRGHPESDCDCPICAIERPRTTAREQTA
ncbi:Hypothetical protein D9617_59g026350 [Elsinoe fawcettii]|nr:Hypothetical protein D9617_59g026350 [Elsinoe fawcettii]